MSLFVNIAHAAGVIEDATPISAVLANILNFLLSVFGVLAIIGLVVSGVLYVTAAGNERQAELAKKAAFGSAVGIAVALSSLVIVRQLGALI